MYLEGDSLHQTIMIMYEYFLIFLYHYCYMMRHLCFLAKVSHTIRILFATFDTIV